MDLYKITSEKDLEEIKFLEMFTQNTLTCIEWPENMGKNYSRRKLFKKLFLKVEKTDDPLFEKYKRRNYRRIIWLKEQLVLQVETGTQRQLGWREQSQQQATIL
jgi:tRNA A37 threonylcarbamoyladenosine biosynthesis protein TsaE